MATPTMLTAASTGLAGLLDHETGGFAVQGPPDDLSYGIATFRITPSSVGMSSNINSWIFASVDLGAAPRAAALLLVPSTKKPPALVRRGLHTGWCGA
ncbi:hypothetical protein [Hymenobacter terrenus]|uniref:hypothetical protein n=1 Tax=Hymenobacter terrenus TaxID=1629124 RepID=UPI000B113C6A|nr:hypothetical protein [Hymenobacter terrenus]